jgi:hypothetical protein
MGTNSAPELANLTLHVEEVSFIDTLLAENKLEEAKKHSDNFRFIDDILTWDVEPPTSEHYGLELSETTLPDGSVVYLGGKIVNVNGRLDISIFDKAAEWPFLVLRYPHAHSNVPYHQPSGVFQGQLVRFRIVCNSIAAFNPYCTRWRRVYYPAILSCRSKNHRI